MYYNHHDCCLCRFSPPRIGPLAHLHPGAYFGLVPLWVLWSAFHLFRARAVWVFSPSCQDILPTLACWWPWDVWCHRAAGVRWHWMPFVSGDHLVDVFPMHILSTGAEMIGPPVIWCPLTAGIGCYSRHWVCTSSALLPYKMYFKTQTAHSGIEQHHGMRRKALLLL